MIFPSVIPLSWKIGAVAALVAGLYFWHVESVVSAHDDGRQQAIAERAQADALAVSTRIKENADMGVKQAATNTAITKAKDEELAPVVRTIYRDRVRIGPAICGPSTATEAASATSSNGADSSGRLVSQQIETDIRALDAEVEKDLATGRACQAFIKENGFIP